MHLRKVSSSELFGHVRGAFTDAKTDRVGRFELADGGTLFLDEIANVPLTLQPKLLRVLETGEFERVGSSTTRKVDVRVLSATNADLHVEVAQGRFRQDLLFRLNTVEIHIPPLRDRREDIAPLAEYFLRQHSERYRRAVMSFTPQALDALREHSWPGNVRELDHVVERALLMSTGNVVTAFDLALQSTSDGRLSSRLEEMSLEEAERILITKALARFEGNANRAAEALGLSRSALYRRLRSTGCPNKRGSGKRGRGKKSNVQSLCTAKFFTRNVTRADSSFARQTLDFGHWTLDFGPFPLSPSSFPSELS